MQTAIQTAVMSTDDPDREELVARLDELEATLSELRSELDSEQRGPPQPPSLGDLLRFTEQYTIPTLIAILEATVRSLELLRRTLRLADPARAASEEADAARSQLDQVGTEAGEQLAGALSELRTALSATELPENEESRRLVADARELTSEIENRLRDAEQTVRTQRSGEASRESNGVMIDVNEESTADADEESSTPAGTAAVDVDAELESIKQELDAAEKTIEDANGAGPAEKSESDDGEDETAATGSTDDSDEQQPDKDSSD